MPRSGSIGGSVRTEPKVAPKIENFVFKSKFKEDKVTLAKPRVQTMTDGTKVAYAPTMAEFSRYTWSTDDNTTAAILRGFIAKRLKEGVPLHITETTDLKAPEK